MDLTFNQRSLDVLKSVVDCYITTGSAIGSQAIAESIPYTLSSATVRNVLSRLQEAGLIYAPHTSAGRLPTEKGLKYFVNGLLKIGSLSEAEKRALKKKCQSKGYSPDSILKEASRALSGLTQQASLVVVPKVESKLKHMEFLPLDSKTALLITVSNDGTVQNRVINLPPGLIAASLTEVSNYINAHYVGRSLHELQSVIKDDMSHIKAELDATAEHLVSAGLAQWIEANGQSNLILTGQENLLNNVTQLSQIEEIKRLYEELNKQECILSMLKASVAGKGVQIFIGSDNAFFSATGCSVVVSPSHDGDGRLIGALGVVGPMRLDYGRVIPMVDYTAKIVGKMLTQSVK